METNPSSLHEEFLSLFAIACKSGACINQVDFARYIGVTTTTINGAFGKKRQNLTPALINKIRRKLIEDGHLAAGASVNIGECSVVQSPDGVSGIPAEVHKTIIAGILDEMRAQRETYERIILAVAGKTDK